MALDGGWYLGGELGFGSGSASPTASDPLGSYTESENYNFSIDAKAGRVVDGLALIYGKLGYSYGNFNASDPSIGLSKDEGFSGLRLGGGIEMPIYENFTGRIEAIYTTYESRTIEGLKFSPQSEDALIGVSYHFH